MNDQIDQNGVPVATDLIISQDEGTLIAIGGQREIDEFDEDSKVKFYTAVEIQNAWKKAYVEFIQPAVYGETSADEAILRIEDLTRMLDNAIIHLPHIDDRSLLKSIRKLRSLFKENENEQINETTRSKFRKQLRRVNKEFENLKLRALEPSWIRRNLTTIYGKPRLDVSPEERERYKTIAGAAVRGLSIRLGEKIGMSDEIVKAFQTLDLGVWATREEVLKRYRHIASQYHPDLSDGVPDTRMAEINAAKDLLLREYFG